MVEKALEGQMNRYNDMMLKSNDFEQNWGSIFNFIGKTSSKSLKYGR
jgi:hypothetical protein